MRLLTDPTREGGFRKRIRNQTPEEFEALFWSQIIAEKNGCIIWTGRKINGYGTVWDPRIKRYVVATKVAFEFIRGKVKDGLIMCHNCPGGDNPACVNPNHLFPGTRRDNADDAIKKNQYSCLHGEDHPNSIMTAEKVIEIRKLVKDGRTLKSVASEFGIHFGTVWQIARRKSWRTIP